MLNKQQIEELVRTKSPTEIWRAAFNFTSFVSGTKTFQVKNTEISFIITCSDELVFEAFYIDPKCSKDTRYAEPFYLVRTFRRGRWVADLFPQLLNRNLEDLPEEYW